MRKFFAEADIVVAGRRGDFHGAITPIEELKGRSCWGRNRPGIVEVEDVVIVAVHELAHVERAAESDAAAREVGMFEREVESMISAEAATGGGDLRRVAEVLHERREFFDDVTFVDVVAGATRSCGWDPTVVPAFGIDTIDAEDHEFGRRSILTATAWILPLFANSKKRGWEVGKTTMGWPA